MYALDAGASTENRCPACESYSARRESMRVAVPDPRCPHSYPRISPARRNYMETHVSAAAKLTVKLVIAVARRVGIRQQVRPRAHRVSRVARASREEIRIPIPGNELADFVAQSAFVIAAARRGNMMPHYKRSKRCSPGILGCRAPSSAEHACVVRRIAVSTSHAAPPSSCADNHASHSVRARLQRTASSYYRLCRSHEPIG